MTQAEPVTFVNVSLDHECVRKGTLHIGCLQLNTDGDGLWYVFTPKAGAMIARYRTLLDAQKGASKWLPRRPKTFKEDGV